MSKMKLYVLKYLFTNPQSEKEEREYFYNCLVKALEGYEDLKDKWYVSDLKIYLVRYSEDDNITVRVNELLGENT